MNIKFKLCSINHRCQWHLLNLKTKTKHPSVSWRDFYTTTTATKNQQQQKKSTGNCCKLFYIYGFWMVMMMITSALPRVFVLLVINKLFSEQWWQTITHWHRGFLPSTQFKNQSQAMGNLFLFGLNWRNWEEITWFELSSPVARREI